jgi:hypothetical protein
MRVLRVFRNKTPPIFFILSVFIAYGYFDLYDRPQLIYPLFLWSTEICEYSHVFVGIEDDRIGNTRKFPHPIKIERIYIIVYFSAVSHIQDIRDAGEA